MHSAHKSIPKALGLGFQHNSADDKPSPTYHSTHRFKDRHCPVPVTRGWAPGLKLRHGLCCVHSEQPHAWLFLAVSDSGSIRAEVLPPWPPPHLPVSKLHRILVKSSRHHSVTINHVPSGATRGVCFPKFITASFSSYAKFLHKANSSPKLPQRIINSTSKLGTSLAARWLRPYASNTRFKR